MIGQFRQSQYFALDVKENLQYIIESILNTRIYLHRRQYLVKWSGYEDPTWQDESDLECAQQLVNARKESVCSSSEETLTTIGFQIVVNVKETKRI